MKNLTSFVFLLSTSIFFGQQKMSITECEEAFQKNNLQLLAEQYNINMSDADVMQAKIWDLPQFSGSINAYNPEDKKIFEVGKSKNAEITQLIYTGGKKKNEIAFAKSNKELAQLQFNQLLVNLRTQLRNTYFNLYYENLKIQNIEKQLGFMNDLLAAYKVQQGKGNVSLRDQVRLQSMVIQLNSDKIEINNAILGYEQGLKLLTGVSNTIVPEISDAEVKDYLAAQPFGDAALLKEKALQNNADYLFNLKMIDNSKLFAQWQKSLNAPDFNVGVNWAQNGGVFKNEANLLFSVPIPLWKTNRGNVAKANFAIQQNQKNSEYQKLNLETQIDAAYQTWKNQFDQFHHLQAKDIDDLEAVYNGTLKNFRNGNISLIEFTDFTESYRQTVLQIYEMKKHIMTTAEDLNQLVQTKIFY